ncbi:MFS transporter [Chloroflexota bacterium]
MVAAAVIMHFFGGGTFFYGFTVFFNPIRQTFGWTAAITSVAFSLQRLELGILSPLAGFMVDRIGPRKMMFFGWAIAGAGFIYMSTIDSLWGFYGSFLAIAVGFSFASGTVINTAIANWFQKKRSRALALTYLGPGLSGILAPVMALSIGQFGWRQTLIFAGIALCGICVPLSLVMRHKPSQYGLVPDGEETRKENKAADIVDRDSLKESKKHDNPAPVEDYTARQALATRAFWFLAIVFIFQQVAQSAVMVHIVPYLESVAIPTTMAAYSVTGMTLFSLIGRLGFGILGDFRNKRYLIAWALTLQTIGLLVFSLVGVDKVWLVFLFLLTYGPGYGGPIPLRSAIQADYFGTKSFGTIMGLMSTVGMLGGLASPIIAGWVFDVTESYRIVWVIFTFVLLPSVPFMLLAKPPVKKPD